MGFGVSGFEQGGWFRPLLQGRPEWVTGGKFGPEASIFAVIVDLLLILILILWKWKGSVQQLDTSEIGPSRKSISDL